MECGLTSNCHCFFGGTTSDSLISSPLYTSQKYSQYYTSYTWKPTGNLMHNQDLLWPPRVVAVLHSCDKLGIHAYVFSVNVLRLYKYTTSNSPPPFFWHFEPSIVPEKSIRFKINKKTVLYYRVCHGEWIQSWETMEWCLLTWIIIFQCKGYFTKNLINPFYIHAEDMNHQSVCYCIFSSIQAWWLISQVHPPAMVITRGIL